MQSINRGYEFKLKNDSSFDRVVNEFRITADLKQQFVLKITSDDFVIYKTPNGVALAEGNTSFMPAFEFKELDNKIIPRNSEISFRIPPLVARQGLEPEAMVVFANYHSTPCNYFANKLESILESFNLAANDVKIRYLVADNYWTPTNIDNPTKALEVACRETEWFSRSESCNQYN